MGAGAPASCRHGCAGVASPHPNPLPEGEGANPTQPIALAPLGRGRGEGLAQPWPPRSLQPATTCRAAARAVRMQPGKNVPSSERLPEAPPPPKPAASPTQYRPSIGSPSAPSTRLCKSVCSPPRLLRVTSWVWMAMKGPAPLACSGAGLQVRRRSGRHCLAYRMRRTWMSLSGWPPGANRPSQALTTASSCPARMSCEAVSAFIFAASSASVSATMKCGLCAAI